MLGSRKCRLLAFFKIFLYFTKLIINYFRKENRIALKLKAHYAGLVGWCLSSYERVNEVSEWCHKAVNQSNKTLFSHCWYTHCPKVDAQKHPKHNKIIRKCRQSGVSVDKCADTHFSWVISNDWEESIHFNRHFSIKSYTVCLSCRIYYIQLKDGSYKCFR